MQIFARWPSGAGQDALDELVRAVSAEIQATTDETKRSKLIALRDTLMSTGRELAIHYFERKVMGG